MPATPAVAAMQHCSFVVGDLLNMAHEVARAMHRRIVEPAPPAAEASGPAVPVLAAAAAFDRAACTIRQTVMVQERLVKGAEAQPARQRIAARKRILREVEDVIQRKASGPRAERLRMELAERLDGWDLEDEIGDRPVVEIIADLCRDLGIAHVEGTHPWKRRTPADIAALCERAARPPGSPAGTIPKSGSDDPSSAPRSGRAARHPVDGDSGETERDVRDLDDGALDGELEALVGELDEQERDDGGQDDAGRDDAEPGFPDPTGFGIGDPRKGAPDLPAARLPAPDMSDYEPGARAWLWPKQVLPGPAAPDTTRPNGRASFRGG